MKIDWNKKYFTISIYTIIVFTVCTIILKFTLSWTDTYGFLSRIISVLSPFLIGILIAYFMNQLVEFFEKKVVPKFKIRRFTIKSNKAKRYLSIFLSYLVLLSFITIVIAIIVPQIGNSMTEIVSSADESVKNLINNLADLSFTFNGITYSLDTSYLSEYINDNYLSILDNTSESTFSATDLVVNIFNMTKNLAASIANLLIAFVVSIYLITSKEQVGKTLKRIAIAFFSAKATQFIFDTAAYAHKVFSNFFVGKIVDSTIIGILCFIVLLIFRIPYSLIISVMVGITNMIPYFGPFIGGAIGFVLLILVNPVKALWFLIIVIILQQFDGNILAPKILGDSIGLSPLWVIFSIIVFGSMFGLIGMFLGAPLLSVIKNVIDKLIDAKYTKKTTIALDYTNTGFDKES
jgi:predicted PurR-regulated permease PerM